MNILYLCDEYPPGRHGGIGTSVQLLARELVKQGHNVTVAGFYYWGYGGKDYFEDEGVIVYRFRRLLSFKILQKQDTLYVRGVYRLLDNIGLFHQDIKKSLKKYGSFLENIITQYKIDLIEMPDYHDYMRFCKSYIPFPKLSVPVIIKLHGGFAFFLKEAHKEVPAVIWNMEKDLLAAADSMISVSRYTANKYAEYFGLQKEIVVLYNGIDTNIDTGNPSKISNRVIFTGTLTEKKGIYQLMKAWNIVTEKKTGATLWVFGKGQIKNISSYLSGAALKTVFFKAHIPREQLFKELAAASVAIFPSFAESFALAPMEAMACGTTVINSECTSGPELIADGINGMLINPHDPADIANKILILLNDNKYNMHLAQEGQKHVKINFNIQKIAIDHIEFYRYVIDKKK